MTCISSARAPVNVDQWTTDINYILSERDRLHGYYAVQQAETREPNRSGNTIPGFGNVSRALRQIFTLNETHIFGANLVNEARAGFNRWSSRQTLASATVLLSPSDYLKSMLPAVLLTSAARRTIRRDAATPPLSWATT